jgi:secreted trypsin-like serine protease
VRARVTLALALLLVLLAAPALGGRAAAVTAGEPANPEAWPFVVALLRPGEADPFEAQFCAGAVVAPTWVLTAAHCVERAGRGVAPAEVQVAAGRAVLSRIGAAERLPVARIARYPGRRAGAGPYDIALLRLTSPARVPAAALSGDARGRAGGAGRAWVAGWGETGTGFPDELLTGQATFFAPAACRRELGLPFGTFCASIPGREASSCFGDSGGPLATFGRRVELVGVVSFGPSDCAGLAAYSNVGLYRPWIDHVLRGGDPAISLPQVRKTRLRQTGAGVSVYANWCQAGAVGHRQRIAYTLRRSGGSSRWWTISFSGRASQTCMQAEGLIPLERLGPGVWRLTVKVRDTTSGLAYVARDVARVSVVAPEPAPPALDGDAPGVG